jgi:hypothetical protein
MSRETDNCLKCQKKLGLRIRSNYCCLKCKKDHENGIGDIIQCAHCSADLIRTRKDRIYCDQSCAFKLKYRLEKEEKDFHHNYKPGKKDSIKEVREFFLKCQSKKWLLTKSDILKLVDYYSDFFISGENKDSLQEEDYINMVIKLKYKLRL